MKVVLISPWGSRCGIAEYAADVYSELARRGLEIKVLAHEEPRPCAVPARPLDVERSWSSGAAPPWRLALRLAQFNPDLVHVQHEMGYFYPESVWQEWLVFLKELGKPVVVTYHSVPDRPNPMTDGEVAAAIAPSPLGALLLRSRLTIPVYNVQHGVDGPIRLGQEREKNALVAFGFLWHSKGYDRILEAMRGLKDEIPDLTLTILGSLTDRAQSEQLAYMNQLLGQVHEFGLSDRVDTSCGFRSRRELKRLLAVKSLGVLHYDRTESASAAQAASTTHSAVAFAAQPTGPSLCRAGALGSTDLGGSIRCQSGALFTLWSAGVPCIVSKAEHFEVSADLEPALVRAPDVESLREAIRTLCCDAAAYGAAQQRLVSCVHRSWSDVADEHLRIFEAVLAG